MTTNPVVNQIKCSNGLTALISTTAAMLLLLKQEKKNQFRCFCFPVKRVKLNLRCFIRSRKTMQLCIFNIQARGKSMGDRSKLPSSLVRLRTTAGNNVLRGPGADFVVCWSLRAATSLRPGATSSPSPSLLCRFLPVRALDLGAQGANSSCFTSSAIVRPMASQDRGRQSHCEYVTFNIPI